MTAKKVASKKDSTTSVNLYAEAVAKQMEQEKSRHAKPAKQEDPEEDSLHPDDTFGPEGDDI